MAEKRQGVVKSVNDGGVLLRGERVWLNFSLDEYRKPPWDDVQEDDEVELTIVTAKNGKDYIQSIEVIGEDAVPSHDAEPAFPEDDEPPESPQPRPGPRGGTLTREKALAAAVLLCQNRLASHGAMNVQEDVLFFARKFEGWILGGE